MYSPVSPPPQKIKNRLCGFCFCGGEPYRRSCDPVSGGVYLQSYQLTSIVMKHKMRLLPLAAGAAALVFGLYPGAIAFAESGDDGVSVQARIEAGDQEGVSIDASTSATLKESDSRGRDSEDSRGRSATSSSEREDSARNADEQGNDEDSGEIEVDHDSALQATTTIKNSDEVHTNGELRSFLNHLVKEDDRIANVQISSTTIETQYALPARFLWAIPTSIPAHVAVGADGSVTITYPWYAFLFAKHDDEIKTQLTQAASSTVGVSTSTALSADTQAHLLNLLFSILRGS